MSVTLDRARKAKTSLKEEFNGESFYGVPVTGIGIGQDDKGDYNVRIYTKNDLSSAQADRLPKERDGVKINYVSSGPIVAQ